MPADAEVDAGGFDQGVVARFYQTRRHRRRCGCHILGQVSHWSVLKIVKRFRNGIAWASSPISRARRFSSSGTKPPDEAVGIGDGGAALALHDIAAERQRLAEGEPALAGEAAFDDRAHKSNTLIPE